MVLACATALAGCASLTNDFTAARDSWQGARYEEVVARWGTPLRGTTLNDGRTTYTWFSEGTVTRTPVWPSIGVSAGSGYGIGVGVGVTAGANREVVVSCERTLIFQNAHVTEQIWRGPSDFCVTFRRY